jgi:SagB-type dehydrogenase family enzyme
VAALETYHGGMKADRRAFFRIVGGAAALLVGGPGPASGQRRALKVHHATRNTLLGALGARLPRLRGPLDPFKTYPGAERVRLPPPRAEAGLTLAKAVRGWMPGRGFRAAPLSLAELSRLLYLTNGVTGKKRSIPKALHLRAAPSAGALYAGEVYVVAERVRGLAPGVYYYDVIAHELARIRSGSFLGEVARALERPGEIANAAAVVLLTNVFARYTWSYANRGYRFALVDTGHIGENLRLAAFAAGFRETGPLRFEDDRLHALLELEGREEAVCALHAVGRAAEPAQPAVAPVRRLVEKHDTAAPERKEGSAIDRYHEATKLVPGAPAEGPPPPRAEVGARPEAAVPLPKPGQAPAMSVERAVRWRRSAMGFGPGPVALADLGFVVEMARGHAALERAPGVDLYVAAHRVRDLAPGLYRYEPRAHALEAVRRGNLSGALRKACLGQQKASSAAVGFVMVAQIERATARAGDRSYRDLLIESGAVGQRIYLAAEAAGLAARNLSAFLDDDLNRLMSLDGRREAAIHVTMLGHES